MNGGMGPQISVIDPVGAAIERMKMVLFRPFKLERWLIIGFCAWLATLMQSGGSGGSGDFRFDAGSARDMGQSIGRHLPLVLVIVGGLLVIGIIVQLVLLWLSSRGKFMFLHCVAGNVAEVKVPWRTYRVQGNSLFLFRLAVGFITVLCFGLVIAAGVVLGVVLARGAGPMPIILIVAIGVPILIFLGIVFLIIGKFTEDFVVPLMALRGCRCVPAWQEFCGLMGANKGRFTVYILFQIVISMVEGFIVLAVVLATCCCAGCLMMIPYIGTVVLLPILVFDRSYSLLYFAQYGPPYNVIAAATTPPQAPSAPPAGPGPYMTPGPYGPPPVQGL